MESNLNRLKSLKSNADIEKAADLFHRSGPNTAIVQNSEMLSEIDHLIELSVETEKEDSVDNNNVVESKPFRNKSSTNENGGGKDEDCTTESESDDVIFGNVMEAIGNLGKKKEHSKKVHYFDNNDEDSDDGEIATYERKKDEKYHRHFYVHCGTGASQWQLPTNGTVKCFDDIKQQTFFSDAATGQTAWSLKELSKIL